MASNDEGQGSGDCDDVYLEAHEYLSLVNDQRLLLLGPPVSFETELETDAETSVETQTCTETGTKTGKTIEPKSKRRCRRPN